MCNDAYHPKHISACYALFRKFNKEVFEDKLPEPEIALTIRNHAYGFINVDNYGKYHIYINWRKCGKRGYILAGTILHEMIHMFQHIILGTAWKEIGHGEDFLGLATRLETTYNLRIL